MKRSGIALVLALVIPCAAFAQGGGGSGGGGGGGGSAGGSAGGSTGGASSAGAGVRLQHLRPVQEPQALRTRVWREVRRLLPRMQTPIQPRVPPTR